MVKLIRWLAINHANFKFEIYNGKCKPYELVFGFELGLNPKFKIIVVVNFLHAPFLQVQVSDVGYFM